MKNSVKKSKRKKIIVIISITAVIAAFALFMKYGNGNYIYISTGMSSSTALKTGKLKAGMAEADILISDAKSQYEKLYGADIWNQSVGNTNFDDYVKNQIQQKLSRVYCMNIMAEEKGVVLSRNQKDKISEITDKYYNTLTDSQKKTVTKETINSLFTRFAIADSFYNDMTHDVDTEVSNDDARVIHVQYICADNKEDIMKAQQRIDNDEIFYVVARDYNPDEYEKECRRGELDEAFENAAYALKNGEVSDIVEADGKYYIIKCTTDNDKSKTEANKIAMEEKKKLDAFNDKFEEFEKNQYVEFNDEQWKKISMKNAEVLGASFDALFNEYKGDQQ